MSVADQIIELSQQNNAWSAEQAAKQMEFQREMSNTAHQREIADLKAAGLNPVLSAKLGGASTPSGAAASADSSVLSAVVEALKEFGEGVVSSAIEASADGTHHSVGPISSAVDQASAEQSGSYLRQEFLKRHSVSSSQTSKAPVDWSNPDNWMVSDSDAKSTTKALKEVLSWIPGTGKVSKAVGKLDSKVQTSAVRAAARAADAYLQTSAPVAWYLTRGSSGSKRR